jgi:hypothetical protein
MIEHPLPVATLPIKWLQKATVNCSRVESHCIDLASLFFICYILTPVWAYYILQVPNVQAPGNAAGPRAHHHDAPGLPSTSQANAFAPASLTFAFLSAVQTFAIC